METKRLIFAIALSMVVIIAYQFFFVPDKKPIPQKPAEVTTTAGQVDSGKTTATQPTDTKTESGSEVIDYSNLGKPTKKIVKDNAAPEQVLVDKDMTADKERSITVETDLFVATFINKGAGLKSFILKKYNDDKYKKPLDLISRTVDDKGIGFYPFYLSPFEDDEEDDATFKYINSQNFVYNGEPDVVLVDGQTKEIVFKFQNAEKKISVTKKFHITNGSYVLGINYEVVVDGTPVKNAPIIFGPNLENFVDKSRVMKTVLRTSVYDGRDINKDFTFSKVKLTPTNIKDVMVAKGQIGGNYQWISYDNTYFTGIFQTSSPVRYWVMQKESEVLEPENENTGEQTGEQAENQTAEKTGEPQGEKKPKIEKRLYSYIILQNPQNIYLGPKDEAQLEKLEKYGLYNTYEIIDYEFMGLGGVSRLMLKGIQMVHSIVPNWGWAIVIFTLFIKIILFPLTYTSMVSMAKMQALQPKIKALKKKYKNPKDPEQRKAMQMEQMALFKSEKVNPAGGCLPMLLQMPILLAMFRLLPVSINFRHESWLLWISDLSVKDPIYLLPILMAVTQIIVSKISPTSAEGGQKKMMYIMPAVMFLLFMSYSAGLNLYWFTSNLIQIGQQKLINERIFKQKKDEERQRKAAKRKKGAKSK